MVLTDFLEKNARIKPDEVALVEINPAFQPDQTVTWREYSLIESSSGGKYRRELTWREFDRQANRFANLLQGLGFSAGDIFFTFLPRCVEQYVSFLGTLKAEVGFRGFVFQFRRESGVGSTG